MLAADFFRISGGLKGFRGCSRAFFQQRQTGQRVGNIGMLRAELPLLNRQGAFQQWRRRQRRPRFE